MGSLTSLRQGEVGMELHVHDIKLTVVVKGRFQLHNECTWYFNAASQSGYQWGTNSYFFS